MYRTHTCGELRLDHKGQEVSLAGWVQTVRKFGSITFVDLRDRYGITQLLFGESLTVALDEQPLGREFVLQATGTVQERSNKNPNLPTGDIEINITSFRILNKSVTPPFTIQDDTDGGDDLRMLMADEFGHGLAIHPFQAFYTRRFTRAQNAVEQRAGFVITQCLGQHAADVIIRVYAYRGVVFSLLPECGQHRGKLIALH